MTTSPSILMYSPDSIGLGHMRRHSAIASSVAKCVPAVSTLMLVGSAAGPFFTMPPGADCVKLPSVHKSGVNAWHPRSLNVTRDAARDLRSGLIQRSVELFRPDIFLVDHVPAGIWGELLPTLRMLRRWDTPPKVVLGLRDILGAPDQIRTTWANEGIYELISDLYDHVLIYGCSDFFPAAEHYGLALHCPQKVSYCGYICSDETYPSREFARDHLKLSGKPLVVVTAGGGHDAHPMMAASVDALSQVAAANDIQVVVITGPLMPDVDHEDVQRRAGCLDVRVIRSTKYFSSYLSAADLVITMGGYNTLMETTRLRKRTIVIPRTGPSAEQKIRAGLFEKLGLIRQLDLEVTSTQQLAGQISAELSNPDQLGISLAFTGLNTVARRLSAMFADAPDSSHSTTVRPGGLLQASNG